MKFSAPGGYSRIVAAGGGRGALGGAPAVRRRADAGPFRDGARSDRSPTENPATPGRFPVQSSPTLAEARIISDRVALLDEHNRHVRWLTEDEARDLVRESQVVVLGTRRKIHAVRLRSDRPPSVAETIAMHRPGPARRKYSHNRETRDNPAGVWTLVRIPSWQRRFFVP